MMTDEEMEDIRAESEIEYAPDVCYEDWRRHVKGLLAHIDYQAAQIAYWQKQYQDLVELNMKEEGAVKLALGAKDRKIAALKEIAETNLAKIIFHDRMMPTMSINNWDTIPDDDFEIKVGNCMLPVKGKKYWMSEARKQLEAEYPEAMR